MKMFYIKPEMDIELVEVESFLAESEGSEGEIVIDPEKPGTVEAPEFVWE